MTARALVLFMTDHDSDDPDDLLFEWRVCALNEELHYHWKGFIQMLPFSDALHSVLLVGDPNEVNRFLENRMEFGFMPTRPSMTAINDYFVRLREEVLAEIPPTDFTREVTSYLPGSPNKFIEAVNAKGEWRRVFLRALEGT